MNDLGEAIPRLKLYISKSRGALAVGKSSFGNDKGLSWGIAFLLSL